METPVMALGAYILVLSFTAARAMIKGTDLLAVAGVATFLLWLLPLLPQLIWPKLDMVPIYFMIDAGVAVALWSRTERGARLFGITFEVQAYHHLLQLVERQEPLVYWWQHLATSFLQLVVLLAWLACSLKSKGSTDAR